jgi:hypothetical protein
MTEITKRELHLRYVVGILVLALVEVLTLLLVGGGDQVLAYITFGVTLMAGVLAVVTIIYTYISNASLSGTVASMQGLGREVSESASRLGKAEQSIDDATKRLSDEVAGHLNMIEKNTQLIPALARRLEESQMAASAPRTPKKADAAVLPDEVAREFVRRSSFGGLLTLQAAAWAKGAGVKLKPTVLADIGSIPAQDYFEAYMVASYAAQMIDFDEKDDEYSVGAVNGIAADEVGPEIAKRIEKQEASTRERWERTLVGLRKMFPGVAGETEVSSGAEDK